MGNNRPFASKNRWNGQGTPGTPGAKALLAQVKLVWSGREREAQSDQVPLRIQLDGRRLKQGPNLVR